MKLQSSGKEILVESAGSASLATDPDVVVLANGQLLVVWTETLPSPTDEFDDTDGGIFARLLNADGTPAGEVFQVNDAQTFVQGHPHVVAFDAGGFAIGWTTTATYGDMPVESDTFLKIYNNLGATLTSSEAFDIVPDNPAPGVLADNFDDQKLHEMVALDDDRIAMVLENGEIYIYSAGSKTVALLEAVDPTELGDDGASDIAVLDNGNIVRAGAYHDVSPISLTSPATDHWVVRLVLSDNDFQTPTGISGIYGPLEFYLQGSSSLSHAIGEVELAALKGGGFAVAYAEKSGNATSVIRLNIITDEALKEFTGQPLERTFAFDSPVAEFDMISLSNGGLALALVTTDTNGTGKGIDILLYDADGTLSTRIQATGTDVGDQANPSLTQQSDGTVVLAYTDTSDLVTAGETNGMRLAFFDVDGASGKFNGSGGNDFLGGVAGNDQIFGLGGDDTIQGRGGNDRLVGGDGNDTLEGGDGKDSLRGNLGNDTLRGNKGNDGIGGGGGSDTLFGNEGRDILGGGQGKDVLRGGAGDDILKGGADNDRLFGDAGNDVLRGHDGSDQLTGGAGSDVFVFTNGQTGSDTITDFNSTEDVIAIHLDGLNKSAVTVSNSGGNTEIEFGSNLITLDDVKLIESDITFDFI